MRDVIGLIVFALLTGLVAVSAPRSYAAEAPTTADLAKAFGFPSTTPGTTDVRIWLGEGIVVPEIVYRLYEDADGRVRGQVIQWLRLHDATYEGHPTNRELTRLMRKDCATPPQVAGPLLWCDRRIDNDTLRITLKDLQLETMFSYSDAVTGNCRHFMEDGETVTIEWIRGEETRRLSISNPDFCCSEPVCAYVNNARDVVLRHMRAPWGQAK